jgi:hypothetical protein
MSLLYKAYEREVDLVSSSTVANAKARAYHAFVLPGAFRLGALLGSRILAET